MVSWDQCSPLTPPSLEVGLPHGANFETFFESQDGGCVRYPPFIPQVENTPLYLNLVSRKHSWTSQHLDYFQEKKKLYKENSRRLKFSRKFGEHIPTSKSCVQHLQQYCQVEPWKPCWGSCLEPLRGNITRTTKGTEIDNLLRAGHNRGKATGHISKRHYDMNIYWTPTPTKTTNRYVAGSSPKLFWVCSQLAN